ncbi:MAG: 2'-5' RNA ligase family protein, partial [Actinomycetota bacterium]|nr:2'-5' RNA ligase family protein [Actinomycetota bacterium]
MPTKATIARPRVSGRETVRLAYAILLADDAHNAARRLAVELYERYRPANDGLLIPPHVTLKQPFETPELARCEELLDRVAADTAPFDLVLRGFGTFTAEGVVFIDVAQDERLFALQR